MDELIFQENARISDEDMCMIANRTWDGSLERSVAAWVIDERAKILMFLSLCSF